MSAQQIHSQAGYSIVELVVSAVLLGLLIIGMVSMVQKGTELGVQSDHRRQARSLINAAFDSSEFDFRSYAAITTSQSRVDTVYLDPEESAPVKATLKVVVASQQNFSVSGTNVPYKRVSMTVRWILPKEKDSITVEKWLSDAD